MPNYNRGANQHRQHSFISEHPNLPDIIQQYLNDNVLQKDLPTILQADHQIYIKLRSIQRIMKDHKIKTVRKPKLNPVEMGLAILEVGIEDPLGRWGCRLVKEKLAKDGVHVTRDFIMDFRKAFHEKEVAARHPATCKLHQSVINSIGPNEEWCIDGHEKILRSMGIAVWGINDKYSRHELGLWAVPNARLAGVPPVLYLRLVRKLGGMPVTTTADKGSELSKLIPLITTLRQIYQPFIDEEVVVAHRSVKSVYNITRECGWRPLWEKTLGNIRHFYMNGKIAAGFHEGNPIHSEISIWLWAAIVQHSLDEYRKESGNHKVCKQKKSLLPTDGRHIDMYERPENFGGMDCLIKVPAKDVDMLLEEYAQPGLFLFNSPEMSDACKRVYTSIGSPILKPSQGWEIFKSMVEHQENYTSLWGLCHLNPTLISS